jgi:FkbM family methyltransferase
MGKATETTITRGDFNELVKCLPQTYSTQLLENQERFKSQLGQDLFVLAELGFKRNGYFVEFGAADGLFLSNTYLLEEAYDWRGILAEPARCWHAGLTANRSASIDTSCVWTESNAVLRFNEVDIAGLSTIDAFSSADFHIEARKSGTRYDVATISLLDLLRKHGAPRHIDYLSIDTEGSELDILRSFDFDQYTIRVITCEHNFTPLRDEIFALLTSKGYTRKLQHLTKVDDWYVLAG